MEPDEINPTFEASEESYNRICMTFVIIEPGKHGILETYSALSGKVIFADQGDHIPQVIGLLHRHQLSPLVREGVVKTDGQMTFGLIQVFFQCREHADG